MLSHTAHSVSKKGVKRRDLHDVEFRDILDEILPLVRINHVVPHNHEVLMNAIRRGLVSTPPSHMIYDDAGMSHTASAWVPSKNNGLFTPPRLFTPYYEEVKVRFMYLCFNFIVSKIIIVFYICWLLVQGIYIVLNPFKTSLKNIIQTGILDTPFRTSF